MVDRSAAHATRLIQAWIADESNSSARAIVADAPDDEAAAGDLHDFLFTRLVERHRSDELAVDWPALARWLQTEEELDDVDLD
jgi:hypothetical protein